MRLGARMRVGAQMRLGARMRLGAGVSLGGGKRLGAWGGGLEGMGEGEKRLICLGARLEEELGAPGERVA